MHTNDRKNKTLYVDTVADMLALTGVPDGTRVDTARYSTSHAVGDGSGGEYVYHATGRSGITADGGFFHNGAGADDYWELKDQTIANVMQFGAVGKGAEAHDDTASLQAALNAGLTGALVDIPKGEYGISATLILDLSIGKRINIRGHGLSASKITKRNTFSGASLIATANDNPGTLDFTESSFHNIYLFGMSANGNRVSHGINLATATHCSFRQVRIQNVTNNAWMIGYNYSNLWDQCWGAYSKNGWYLGNAVNNNNVYLNCIALNNQVGIHMPLPGGLQSNILGCDIESNTVCGLVLNGQIGVNIQSYFEDCGATGHTYITRDGGSLAGADWSMKPCIILNGTSNVPAGYAVSQDLSKAYPCSGVSINSCSFSGASGRIFAAMGGAKNVDIQSPAGFETNSNTVMQFYGQHNLASSINASGLSTIHDFGVSVVVPNVTNNAHSSASIWDSRWGVSDPDLYLQGAMSVISGSGGTLTRGEDLIDGFQPTFISGSGTSAYYGYTATIPPEKQYKWCVAEVAFVPLASRLNTSYWNVGIQMQVPTTDGNYTTDANQEVYRTDRGDALTTGSITSGSSTLTVNSSSDIKLGWYIIIEGAGPAGGTLVSKVVSIVGTTITLSDTASTTVSGEDVLIPSVHYRRFTYLASGSGSYAVRKIGGTSLESVAVLGIRVRRLGTTANSFSIVPVRKQLADDLGNLGATATINFDAATGDGKYGVVTANTAITFSGDRTGEYWVKLIQDGTGGHNPTFPNIVNSPPTINATADAETLLRVLRDESGQFWCTAF